MTAYQIGREIGFEHAAGDTSRWCGFRQFSKEYLEFYQGYQSVSRNT